MNKQTNISKIEHVGVLVNGDIRDSTIQLVGFKACDTKECSELVAQKSKYCSKCKKNTVEIFGFIFLTVGLFLFISLIIFFE